MWLSIQQSNSGAASTVTVQSSGSTEILAAGGRQYAGIYNNGAVTVWLALGATAVVGSGIPLVAGAFYEAPAALVSLAINGKAASSTAACSTQVGTFSPGNA